MPTLPDVFIVPNVPADELPDMQRETDLEGIFTMTTKGNDDGTFDVTFTRKKEAGSDAGAGAGGSGSP